jgi:hypothetical protein
MTQVRRRPARLISSPVRALASKWLATQLAETREHARLAEQLLVAVPGDNGRLVAGPAEHERVTPPCGAVDAHEQAALLRPGDQVAVAGTASPARLRK